MGRVKMTTGKPAKTSERAVDYRYDTTADERLGKSPLQHAEPITSRHYYRAHMPSRAWV